MQNMSFKERVDHNVYLIETTANIDRGCLDNSVDDLGQGRQVVRAGNFRVEKDFWCQETFESNIYGIRLMELITPPVC
jgi:hypothetical protein